MLATSYTVRPSLCFDTSAERKTLYPLIVLCYTLDVLVIVIIHLPRTQIHNLTCVKNKYSRRDSAEIQH